MPRSNVDPSGFEFLAALRGRERASLTRGVAPVDCFLGFLTMWSPGWATVADEGADRAWAEPVGFAPTGVLVFVR
jgi:hypothetical protein